MAQSEKELREAVKMVLAAHSSFYDVVIQGIWGQLKGRSLGTRVISLPETRAASFLDEYRHYYVIDPIIPAYAIVHEAKQHLELTKLEYPASSSRRSATRFEAIEVSDVPGVDLLLLVTQPSGGG